MSNDRPDTARPTTGIKNTVAAVTGAVLLTALLTGLLYARAELAASPPPKEVLTVSTTVYRTANSYQRTTSYLGLVAAANNAQLSFQIPGQLATLLSSQGSRVRAGDTLATLDDAALQAQRRATAADLEQARAELELAQLKSKRQSDLRATGAVSKEAYDETRLQSRASQARVEAVTARLAGIDIEIDKTQLVAPYDGVIADRYAHEGTVVNAGTPVVRLVQTAAREAHIGISATRSAELAVNNTYQLTLRGEPLTASLLAVRDDVDPMTRTTTAIFGLPADLVALDGEPITLALPETVHSQGGWLPIAALLEGRRGTWTVLRVVQSERGYHTEREVVEVLAVAGDKAYVRGSLENNAPVVASGLHRITPGAPVTPEGSF